ncbi:MAG: hybrid sensor histidine kinase/response regulator [Mesorhizobium amorphae]|nr:MAG: hybrid sensor histidine kinase/response regulator [Mesorhizobium amorphae]
MQNLSSAPSSPEPAEQAPSPVDRIRPEHTARHLRAVIASAVEVAIIATNREGLVTDWNTGAENVFGWSASEMLGRPAAELFTPEDRESGRVATEKRLSLQDGRSRDERWHLRKDGSRFFASGEIMPLRDEGGAHLGFLRIVRDRTPEHLAQRALEETEVRLRASEERYRALFDAIDDGFCIIEFFDGPHGPLGDYVHVEANPGYGRHTGIPDVVGKTLREIAPGEADGWAELYGGVLRTGEPIRFERHFKAVGRFIEVSASRVEPPSRRQVSVLFRDITARKEAENRLRESEAVARANVDRVQLALAAGAITGTWHWDLPTDRFTVDEAFARSFGLDPALGRSGLSLAQVIATVHPEDRAGLIEAIDEVVARGGAYAHQYRVRRTDGLYHWIEANGRVDHAPDGTPQTFPGVLIDVGERRAVEAERDRAITMLRGMTETLEQRVAERTAELMRAEEALRQSQKMEAVGQLTGGLAHDFNNLLAGISGSLELMGRRIEQNRVGEVARYLSAAQDATKRAAALTHRLLAFSRRQTLAPKAISVNALVADMLDLIRRTVGPGIRVETRAASDLWTALVDPSQLENALLNLCINARDAMPDGGTITIETENRTFHSEDAARHELEPGEYLSLGVSDTGAGMSAEVTAKAFDPFFTTKPLGQGTGLGLSMIYGFAQQSGGQVRIASELGRGTTVRIYLPRHRGETAAAEGNAQGGAAPVAQRGETVLVVDDEPTVRMLVTAVLDELGYTALEAGDSAGGLRALQSDARIDLLISDVGLPGGMNGRQMADAARLLRPDLKVLFITGYAENALFNEDQLEPGMDVLTKPFSVDALAARIRRLIARQGRSPS